MRNRRVAGQQQAAHHQRRFTQQHHRPPVSCISQRAAHESDGEDGGELQHPEQADQQHAVGQLVDLVGERDDGDHAAEKRHEPPDEQEAEVAMAPQRGDIDRRQVPPAPWRAHR